MALLVPGPVNDSAPTLRQCFTLVHEIAHVWLDHLRADASLTDELAEGEANFLAGYLLAPDALVITWAPELTIWTIAEAFHISEDAAKVAHARVLRALNRRDVSKPDWRSTRSNVMGHHSLFQGRCPRRPSTTAPRPRKVPR